MFESPEERFPGTPEVIQAAKRNACNKQESAAQPPIPVEQPEPFELRFSHPHIPEETLSRVVIGKKDEQKSSPVQKASFIGGSIQRFIRAGDWIADRLDGMVKPIMHLWPARLAAASVILIGGTLLMFSPIPGGMVLIPIGLAIPFGVAPGKSWARIKRTGHFIWKRAVEPLLKLLFTRGV